MEKERNIWIKSDFQKVFHELGMSKGQNVIVHTSMKKFGFVCGGPQVIIEALMDVVGEEGTIMMPTQSWKNLDPSAGVHWEEPKEWWPVIREHWPAYHKDITPTNTMGAVAEMFRKWPGALRSDHPARSFAAWGKHAKWLTEDHDLENIFGIGSPLHRLYELDGYILLLGVGYDKNTSLHLADSVAEYPSKYYAPDSSAIMVDGERKWVTYQTLVVDGEDFPEIGKAFEAKHKVQAAQLGDATLKLMKQKELVDFAVNWIEKNR